MYITLKASLHFIYMATLLSEIIIMYLLKAILINLRYTNINNIFNMPKLSII